MAASGRTCLQCGKPSKYCCPKCSARSCSLPCVKRHKKIGECDGIRDKTAYVPLDGFTDLDLLSDYRFLEESARVVDSVCRTKPALGVYPQQKTLPGFLHKFQAECRHRGTMLKLLPRCFTKRQENKSQFNFREHCIYWHVAWVFPAARIKVHEIQRVHEKESLGRCLEKHLTMERCRPELRGPLQQYITAGMQGVSVLLAVEGKPASQKYYYNLDLSMSLENCLKGKVIVEYPTFTVIQTEDLCRFNLISPEPSGSHSATSLPAFFNTNVLADCDNE
ncbi:box C/D snoRNA protein 1 isoform X1 [Amblyomma americanum]|uniref:HIT-type domain-containing protein n=1 Tax=Amblyomma americanum TaxID=6943 RepID=A0AAQ4D8Z9_AMBAM